MAHQARTERLGGLAPDPAALAPTRSRFAGRDLLDGLWDLLTSMRFAMVLILAMAALGFVGSLLIQTPAGIAADATAKADWLAEVRPKYGGWTDVIDRIGFFDIFGSIWFRGIVAFLTASLIACMTQRAPALWHTATKPRVSVGEAFFAHARERDTIVVRGEATDLLSRVAGVLRQHHYRVVVEEDEALNLYGDKNRWAPFGSLFGHLSIVVILAGVMVGAIAGYRDGNFVIAEGSTVAVLSGDGLSLQLVSFEDAYYSETGAPSDFASELVLFKDGAEVARQTIRVNDPLRYGDLSFYQSFYGPAIAMHVADAGGQVLFEDGVPLAWSTKDDKRRVGTFTVPGKDVTVWLVGTLGPTDPLVKPGQIRVETYRASTGDAIEQVTVDQGVATDVSGLTFTFGRELQFSGLSVSRDPGTILVWIGSFLLMAGFTIGFSFPHRRIWGRLTLRPDGGGSLSIATPGRVDHDLDQAFTNLVTDLRAACAAPART